MVYGYNNRIFGKQFKIRKTMRLSKLAHGILKDRAVKKKIAELTNKTENTIYAWIKSDSDNLTKAVIVEYFETEYGLTRDQILESEYHKDTIAA